MLLHATMRNQTGDASHRSLSASAAIEEEALASFWEMAYCQLHSRQECNSEGTDL